MLLVSVIFKQKFFVASHAVALQFQCYSANKNTDVAACTELHNRPRYVNVPCHLFGPQRRALTSNSTQDIQLRAMSLIA